MAVLVAAALTIAAVLLGVLAQVVREITEEVVRDTQVALAVAAVLGQLADHIQVLQAVMVALDYRHLCQVQLFTMLVAAAVEVTQPLHQVAQEAAVLVEIIQTEQAELLVLEEVVAEVV
jgi:uncharacterized membrane protein